MSHKSFAIVCDSTCGLPSELLARLEAVCVPLRVRAGGDAWADDERDASAEGFAAAAREGLEVELPSAEEYRAVFDRLADEGFARIACVASSLEATGTWAAVEEAQAALARPDVRVCTVDAGVTSLAEGMLVERLASARAHGVGFADAIALSRELAREARLLFIPASSSEFVRRSMSRHHKGLVARASALRLRIAGERSLYLLWRGEATALARSTDIADLCARAAHAMSSVASKDGELVYALVSGTDLAGLRALEKPLDTNEFESLELGRMPARASFIANVGCEAVGVAFAPKALYLRAGGRAMLPDGLVQE